MERRKHTNAESVMVSVLMITYNHENYIAEAIEGVLMQETSFSLELIICNDASTDDTNKIIEKYIGTTHRVKSIRYFNHRVNLGMIQNFAFALGQCNGKYIALCEGDDYWIDPRKLEKQVAFLESNEQVSICATNYHTIENNVTTEILRNDTNEILIGNFTDIVKSNMIPTLTSVFRSSSLDDLNLKNILNMPYPDWIIWASILNQSKLSFAILPDITSVQHIHDKGAFSSITDRRIIILNALKTKLKIFGISSRCNKGIVSKNLYNFYLSNGSYLKGNKNRVNKIFFYLYSFLSNKN